MTDYVYVISPLKGLGKRIMTLRSRQFVDIYFSPGKRAGRDASRLSGRKRASRSLWRDRERFVIAETGFGTGLNFLAVWALVEKTAKPGQRLHYISFEKYPLSWDECAQALEPWRGEFGARLDRLRALYPLRVPGFHRLTLNEQVTLTLIFDDVNEALPQLEAPGGVDAWFLDGFAPAKNPQMWTDDVFAQMARLSHDGTTAATFTVAGVVRRGLAAVGFAVEKKQGFGRKREMLTARFAGKMRAAIPNIRRVAIVGGGLAGTAAAFVLKQRGLTPVLFEKGATLASGASGNPEGLYNPRLSAQRTPESDFHTSAWAQGVRTFADMQGQADIGFNPCGSLHLATDPEKEKKLRGALENWGWNSAHMRWLDAAETSRQAGVTLQHPALWLPDAGTVSPAALCRAWAAGIDVRLNTPVAVIDRTEFDAVILACGTAVTSFAGLEDFPVHAVRGQMTEIRAMPVSKSAQSQFMFRRLPVTAARRRSPAWRDVPAMAG